MKRIENRFGKNAAVWLLFLLFACCFLLRFFLTDYPKQLSIKPDELRYYYIAESLLKSGTLSIYNQASSYQKILYSLFIMPAFLVSDKLLRIRIIGGLNCLAASSGLFPVYLLGKKYLSRQKSLWFACVLYCVYSDLGYTVTFISESLFLPMSLWAVYIFSNLLDCEMDFLDGGRASSKRGMLSFFLVGLYLYLLYLCKEVGLVFLLGWIAVILLALLKRNAYKRALWKKPVLHILSMLAGFAIPFLLLKCTLFQGLGNSYSQQDLSALANPFNWFYMCYGMIYFVAMILLSYAVYPVLVPLLCRRQMDEKARYFLVFLLLLLLASAGTVAYTITGREDFGNTNPRFHARYVCYLFLPFVILMLHTFEGMEAIPARKKLLGGVAGLFAWYVYSLLMDGNKCLVNSVEAISQTTLMYIFACGQQWIPLALVGAAIFACCLVLWKNKRVGAVLICLVLVVVNLANNVVFIRMWREYNGLDEEQCTQAEWISDFVSEHGEENILVITDEYIAPLWSTFGDEANVFVVDQDTFQSGYEEIELDSVSWKEFADNLVIPYWYTAYDELERVDYIYLSDDSMIEMIDSDAELVDSPLDEGKLYHLSNPEIVPALKLGMLYRSIYSDSDSAATAAQ